jgi:hypothetical protein
MTGHSLKYTATSSRHLTRRMPTTSSIPRRRSRTAYDTLSWTELRASKPKCSLFRRCASSPSPFSSLLTLCICQATLAKMLAHEIAPQAVPHPSYSRFSSPLGSPLSIFISNDGSVRTTPATVMEPRGGILYVHHLLAVSTPAPHSPCSPSFSPLFLSAHRRSFHPYFQSITSSHSI